MGIVIAFVMAAVNLPLAVWGNPDVAWFNWLACGICTGMGISQVLYRVMHR